MLATDTSERGLESLIVAALTGQREDVLPAPPSLRERVPPYAGSYVEGDPADYDRDHAVDAVKLLAFLRTTQPRAVETLGLDGDGPRRRQFLDRLQGEVDKRGVIDVLRKGLKHGPASVELFYGTPTPGNASAEELFHANVFSITRQLRYSKDETRLALDLCLFLNGLPIATFELKNRLTKQTGEDAVEQYRRDRDPRELLFQFGRCMVHFAVDDSEVRMCTHLRGKDSWFLPFNQGWQDGAGNPPNPDGLKTAYLWQRILAPAGLTDILENYAQVVEERDDRGRRRARQ
jgi:type I restriction enzyme R subunit